MPSFVKKAKASIKGSFSGHKALHAVIGAQEASKSAAKVWAAAQADVAKSVNKWGREEKNPAIREVCTKLLELSQSWTEAQTKFSEGMKLHRSAFAEIVLQEKTSDASKKVKGTAEQKTKKAEQKLSSVRRKGESTVTAEAKLRQAHSMLETLAADEEDTYAEVERAKVRYLKDSLTLSANSYLELLEKGIIIFEAQKALASLIAEEPENIEVDAGGSPPRTPASRRRAASLRSARSARSNFSQWSEESDEGIFAGGQHRLSKSCGGDLDTIAGSRTPNSIRKTRKEPRSVTDIDLADVAAARAIVASGSQSVTGTSVGGPAPRHVAGRASQPLPDSSSTSFDAHIYAVPGEESDGGEKAAKEPPPSAAGVNNTSRDSVASNGETDLWQQGGFFSPGQERSGTSIVNSRSRRVSAQGPPPPPPPEMVPRRQQQSQKGSGGPSVNLRKTPASHGDVSLNPHSRPASTSVSRPNSTYSVPGEVDSDSDAIEARVTTVASDSGISHASDTAKHSSSSTSEVFTSSVPGVYDNVGGLRSPSAGWSDPYDSEAKSVGNSPTYANIERQQSSVGTAGFEAVAIGSIRPDVTQAGQPGPPPPPVPPAGSHRRTKSGGSLENSGSVEVSPRRKRSATEVQPADIAAAWAKHQANVSSPRTVADQPLRPAPPPPSQAQSRPGHSRSRSRGSGDFIGFGGGTSPERQPSAMSMAGGMNQIRAANIPSGFGPGKDASGWSEHIQRAAVQ